MWYTLFRSGSKIEVDGTWVGDMGHVPKPEGCGETYQSCMDGMLRVMWKYS